MALITSNLLTDAAKAGPAIQPAVVAVGLSKEIDGRSVLKSVNLSLPPGTCCALMGANGAGKTTLLKILAATDPPSGGSLEIFGRRAAPRDALLRRRIGFIGHHPMLYRDLTCLENLVLFGRLYRLEGVHERAVRELSRVGMAERADDRVGSLSSGMIQRVAIARALVHDPDLLLADEPFTGLDSRSVSRLERCLLDLRAMGRTIVFTDHAAQHAVALSDRTVVLRHGAKVLDAPSIDLASADVLHAMEEER
ncbi:MAG: ABC transporter ATP-binding protein [Planctomycetes bacterium]|nr:ABC transporter ATP-binding protein [Planctomycetota bacterium]